MKVARAFGKDERPLLEQILAVLAVGGLVALQDEAQDLLEEVVLAGNSAALIQVRVGGDDEAIVNQLNELALAYARDRAAEMVGKKWVGDVLIDNPNAEWTITESTRQMLREEIATGIEEGWSNDRIADALESAHAFSEERATTIARTETAFADVEGNLQAYKAMGVESKEWLASDNCCDDCQELDGTVVGINEDFPKGGGDGPPLHPNCECDVLPVIPDD